MSPNPAICRRFAFGALLAAALVSGASAAESIASPEAIEGGISYAGMVSVEALSALSALSPNAAIPQRRNVAQREQPAHRLRNGKLTSAPDPAMLNSLPLAAEPNAAVLGPRAALSAFRSVKGFVGIFGGENAPINGFELEPPDQGLAVNNGFVAEINNSLVQFFGPNGAALTNPIATSDFFVASGFNLSDTQAFFDPSIQRWFLDTVIYNDSFRGFAVAISQTSDPLGNYWVYHLKAFSSAVLGCGGTDCFPDYPKAGYDASAFYITANMYNNASLAPNGSQTFVESAIYVLPKWPMMSGSTFTFYRFDDPADIVVQPSVPAPGEPFSTANHGSEFLMSAAGQGNIAVLSIEDTTNILIAGRTMKMRRILVPSQAYGFGTVPSQQPNVVGPYCQSQGVTSAPMLDGGLSAFQATVQMAGERLYGVLAFGARDRDFLARDVLAWFAVQPTLTRDALTAQVVHQGHIVPGPGYSASYPAFALNQSGAGAIGMTITNIDASAVGGYPSAAYIQFNRGPVGGIVTTGPGFTSDDGFTGCTQPGPGNTGRWGDYGAGTVDAVTGYFYLGAEMIPNPTLYPRGSFENWGTFITQLH